MIDFHTHILPAIDDGSSSVEESLEMLHLSYREGVRKIVATPHFYAHKESPKNFLERRNKSWRLLSPLLPRDTPNVYLGAEVYYYTGISNTKELIQLCIGGGNTLLLEMPFHRWTERMVDEVIDIAQNEDITILLAHIDRYLDSQTSETWDTLAENGVLFQMNASAFLGGWFSRRRAFKLLRDGKIAALGSDCHNTTNRKPNLSDAVDVIEKKLGQEPVRIIKEKETWLLASCKTAVGN